MLYYYHRFIIQKDEIEQHTDTSYVIELKSSNCDFQEALIALTIASVGSPYQKISTKTRQNVYQNYTKH